VPEDEIMDMSEEILASESQAHMRVDASGTEEIDADELMVEDDEDAVETTMPRQGGPVRAAAVAISDIHSRPTRPIDVVPDE
jgi:hypothetical protein